MAAARPRRFFALGALAVASVLVLLPRLASPWGSAPGELVSLAPAHPATLVERGTAHPAPVILFLHGGPGVSVAPAAWSLHGGLQAHARIVHWEQPGSTTRCLASGEPLTLAGVLAEAEAVAEGLRARHGVERLGLVGASWGSVLGLLLSTARPDLFWAYVGEGQVLDTTAGEAEALLEARRRAEAAGDTASLERLAGLEAPLHAPQDVGRLRRELVRHGMIWQRPGPYLRLGLAGLVGTEHTVLDKLRTPVCVARAAAALSGELRGLDLDGQIRETAVPTYAFQGRHDHLAPPGLVEDWAREVGGQGVEVVWFEESGHVPSIEEPEAWVRHMRERVLVLAGS